MNGLVDTLLARLGAGEQGVLVRVHATQGSAPREAGTWMAVWDEDLTGTIGGGQLEFQATQEARSWLAGGAAIEEVRRYPLGPSLGQCCGGVVFLAYQRIGPEHVAALRAELTAHLSPVALFGGGHVGAALARLLSTLPFSVRWIDSLYGQESTLRQYRGVPGEDMRAGAEGFAGVERHDADEARSIRCRKALAL